MDRRFRGRERERRVGTSAPERSDVRVQPVHDRAIAFEQLDRRARHGRDRRRQRRRVDVGARALHQPFDDTRRPGDERSVAAERLAERGHADDALRAHAEVIERAASAGPEHADAVRVVEHQPRVVPLAQSYQRGDRRDVAIHAEDGVARHDLARRGARAEELAERLDVAMGIDGYLPARETRAVHEAGVVQRVREHFAVAAAEGGEDAEVRGITAREEERARGAHERREAFLGFRVWAQVPGDQRRGARAETIAVDRGMRGFAQPPIVRETEIVVAGKIDERARADAHVRALRRIQHAARAPQAACVQVRERRVERRRCRPVCRRIGHAARPSVRCRARRGARRRGRPRDCRS